MVNQNPVRNIVQDVGSPAAEDFSDGQQSQAPQAHYSCWQAPDRDSPAGDAIDLDFRLEIVDNSNKTLNALLQLDGVNAYDESEVLKKTGHSIERARRWGKFFERMGLMFREGKLTRLTEFGKKLAELPTIEKQDFRRSMSKDALRVLSRYQLRNPADDPHGRYPEDCDVFPYWCIWKAAEALNGRLHWDELNRELMLVLRMEDLDGRIERIRIARNDPDYDPAKGGSSAHPLEKRCYEEPDPPKGKTADGQVRDHYMTPWLKRAGFGGLLLDSPGKGGEGYWTIPDDLLPEVKETLRHPPQVSELQIKRGMVRKLRTH